MRKILFITPWYPTENQPNNGIFIREHARAIHLAGNEVVVTGIIIQPDKKILSASFTEYEDTCGSQVSIYVLGSKVSEHTLTNGENILELNTSEWQQGVYIYTLFVEQEPIETKQMILVK